MTNFSFYALYNITPEQVEAFKKENPDAEKIPEYGQVRLLDKIGFEDLPRENLVGIQAKLNENTQLLTMLLQPGQLPIFRRRGRITASPESKDPIIYLMGWRQKVEGKLIQSITYICDWEGKGFTMTQAGKWEDDHPWFYQPNFFKNEVFDGERYKEGDIWKTK